MRSLSFLATLAVLGAPAGAAAQLSLPSVGTTVRVDFTGFAGSGLASFPGSGQLDSDTWRIQGTSDGDSTWGGTHAFGDFARGASAGGITTGGLYAFYAASSTNPALGVQPTETDFTPGSATLRLRNDTGTTLSRVEVSFDAWFRNDEYRSTSFVLEHSVDDVTYTSTAATSATVESPDAFPAWSSLPFTTTVTGLSIAPGGYLYLRWSIADAGGSGSRDEVAIDDVEVTALGGCASDTDCDDGDVCNGTELCVSASCTTGTPLDCDDLDPCTADACDAELGCTHAPIPGCGEADAGPTDPDAGTADDDAGTPPADPAPDHDAGTAPGTDAGPPPDGAITPGTDAGPTGDPGRRRRSGCSASSTPDATPSALPLLLAALLLTRRRR